MYSQNILSGEEQQKTNPKDLKKKTLRITFKMRNVNVIS